MTATGPTVSKEEVLERVRSLQPFIRSKAQECEQLGKAHPEVVQALRDAGTLAVPAPREFGGTTLEYDTIVDIIYELGHVCGGTAWAYSVWAIHTWWIGQYPLDAQEDFFATGPDTLASSSFGLGGGIERAIARKVDGGYELTGHWKYSSGCDYAEWAMLGVLEASFGGQAPTIDPNLPLLIADGMWLALVHKSQFSIEDNWDVSGLRGSGSKDIIAKRAFVPDHRMLKFPRPWGPDSIGWQRHRRLGYLLPGNGAGFSLSASVFGMCQGIVDEFCFDPSREGSSPVTHVTLGRAAAEVDSALCLMRRDMQFGLEKASRGEELTALEVARQERDQQYGLKACLEAANRLNEVSNAHTLQHSHPIQRLFRDAHAGAKRTRSGMQKFGQLALEAGKTL